MKFSISFILISSLMLLNTLHARGEKSTVPSEIFKGCAKCHGEYGTNKAFGRSEPLAGEDVEYLVESIQFFKESTFSGGGVINVMAKQVNHLNDTQIEDLAVYISNLKKDEE